MTKKEKHAAVSRAWRKRNKEKHAAFNRHAMYGLTAEDYAELVRTHDGCAICQEKSKLGVDHNHTTGKVRGLLCQACNRGLGHFKDSPSLLEKAKEYVLERI